MPREPLDARDDLPVTITRCGRICVKRRTVNLRHVFASQNVNVTPVAERIWLVTFTQYDLGYFDDETWAGAPGHAPIRFRVGASDKL